MYKAAHKWYEMYKKYHCGAIYYDGWGVDGEGLALAQGFCAWLGEDGKLGVDIDDSELFDAFFDSIKREVKYLVTQGVVEDKLAKNSSLLPTATPKKRPSRSPSAARNFPARSTPKTSGTSARRSRAFIPTPFPLTAKQRRSVGD